MTEGIQTGTLDDPLEALRSETRRRLLLSLLDVDHPGMWIDVETVQPSGTPSTPVALRHRHLPKLANYGYVEWDRERDRVRRGHRFHAVEPLLVLLDERSEAFPQDWP